VGAAGSRRVVQAVAFNHVKSAEKPGDVSNTRNCRLDAHEVVDDKWQEGRLLSISKSHLSTDRNSPQHLGDDCVVEHLRDVILGQGSPVSWGRAMLIFVREDGWHDQRQGVVEQDGVLLGGGNRAKNVPSVK